MGQSLYRKYRPKTFAQVAGQQHIKIAIQYQLQQNAVSHAYLFCGPRAVGKTTMARLLAKSMNCQQRKEGEYESCNTCDSCQEVMENRCLDVIEIDAASHTGVDHVREHIIANARVAPSKYAYKIFIIDEVHMLSISAFNALLKMLEEPPVNVIFILATTEVHKIPSTIISRCQRFDFQRIASKEIVEKLTSILKQEHMTCDEEVLWRIAQRSEGCLRDAESLLGQVLSLGKQQKDQHITLEMAELVIPKSYQYFVLQFMESCLKKDAQQGLNIMDQLGKNGANFSEFLQEYIEFLRLALGYMVTKQVDELSQYIRSDQLAHVLKIVEPIHEVNMMRCIDIFLKRRQDMKISPLPQLPIELGLMECCFLAMPNTDAAKMEFSHMPESNVKTTSNEHVFPQMSKEKNQQQSLSHTQTIPVKQEQNTQDNYMSDQETEVPVIYEQQDTSLEEVQKNWSAILSASEKINHSLPFILKLSQPTQVVEGKTVVITFKYPLHYEKSKEKQTLDHITSIVCQTLKKSVWVKTQLNEHIEIMNSSSEENTFPKNQMEDVLEVFGANLVET